MSKAKTRKIGDLEYTKFTIELNQHEVAVLLDCSANKSDSLSEILRLKIQQWLFEEAKLYGVPTAHERGIEAYQQSMKQAEKVQ